jgi:hypothetical protein
MSQPQATTWWLLRFVICSGNFEIKRDGSYLCAGRYFLGGGGEGGVLQVDTFTAER